MEKNDYSIHTRLPRGSKVSRRGIIFVATLCFGPLLILTAGTDIYHFFMDKGWVTDTRWELIDPEIKLERRAEGRTEYRYRINAQGVPNTEFKHIWNARKIYERYNPTPVAAECVVEVFNADTQQINVSYEPCNYPSDESSDASKEGDGL